MSRSHQRPKAKVLRVRTPLHLIQKKYKSPVKMLNSQWKKVTVRVKDQVMETLRLEKIPVNQKPNPKPVIAENSLNPLTQKNQQTNLLPGEKSLTEKAEMIAKAKEKKQNRNQKPMLKRKRNMWNEK